jgi:hypothetical protein
VLRLLLVLSMTMAGCASESSPPTQEREPTNEDRETMNRSLNTTNLSLSARTTRQGDPIEIVFTITNRGPNPADQPELVFAPPPGLSVSGIDAPCSPAPAVERRCFPNALEAGGERRVLLVLAASADGGPLAGKEMTARIANGSFPDPDPIDNVVIVTFE